MSSPFTELVGKSDRHDDAAKTIANVASPDLPITDTLMRVSLPGFWLRAK
jgi:hypothetical protein